MASVPPSPLRKRLDRAGIALSVLCAVHCVFVLLMAGVFGGLLLSPAFHQIGLVAAVALGVVAFGIGLARKGSVDVLVLAGVGIALMAAALGVGHGPLEAVLTIAGVALLAGAHWINLRRAH
ncbi:MerC domain-containing protein [Pseudoblastomonas halimionae]|uniref:MerC family mercury resistance protein n=1 Tax=Alteriqipengyuania halimionae TaxID=1926630 RepID=A0A6I4U905_9SPHN|nr:MerC domain-containing protein [Alteriqipengyuania halimionae]MXP10811.1 MerC family mercury resistance protein [Alteriqipengyuania halimionae]